MTMPRSSTTLSGASYCDKLTGHSCGAFVIRRRNVILAVFCLVFIAFSCQALSRAWASDQQGFQPSDKQQFSGPSFNITGSVTVVTAYYKIPSKFPSSQYLDWIKNFMSLNFNRIIFTDTASYEILSAIYPVNTNTRYRILEIDDFTVSKWDFSRDHEMDHEKHRHSTFLYKIWDEKPFFMRRAIHSNEFGSTHFFWCDIGAFREVDHLKNFAGLPDVRKFVPNKVIFLQVEPFLPSERQNVWQLDNRFEDVVRVGGGMIGGDTTMLLWFAEEFEKILDEADRNGVFKGKDQNLFAFLILRHPDKFHLVTPMRPYGYSEWFYLQYYFSS